jgi:two-component system, response regulator
MSKLPDIPTILLVEDNVDDYEATIRSFKRAHLDNPVHWCTGGKDALRYLRRQEPSAGDRAEDDPSLILLDLNMPGMDGRAVLTQLKEDPELRRIPVVVLTTSADERDVSYCYELGASTYIQKPVDFEGLVQAVGRIKEYWFGVALLPGVRRHG